MQNCSFEKLFPRISAIENPPASLTSGKHTPGRFAAPRESKQDQVNKRPLRNRVLLVGHHRELALYRAEVLRHAGFRVHTPESKQEAVSIIERGNFDVAVLSYTLSNDTVQELADSIREHCPHCPVVAIADTKRVDRRIAPEAIAIAADGPQGLVSALQKALQQR
jgi:CheY-like chemotaxis protein